MDLRVKLSLILRAAQSGRREADCGPGKSLPASPEHNISPHLNIIVNPSLMTIASRTHTNTSRTTIIGSSVFLDNYRLASAERIACLHDAHMRRFVSPIAARITKLGVGYCHPRYHPLS